MIKNLKSKTTGKEVVVNLDDVVAIVYYERDNSYTLHFIGGGQLHIDNTFGHEADTLLDDFYEGKE